MTHWSRILPWISAMFIQQNPMTFIRPYHRGGMISDNLIVIGAADGTLTFLTLYDTLTIHSTIKHVHKEAIEVIWCETETSYIASSDGVISSWRSNDEGAPELKQTFTLPESIFFVCDFPPHYLLAAGKRILYICNTNTTQIIEQVKIVDDITGLSSNAMTGQAILSTAKRLYIFDERDLSAEFRPEVVDLPCPRMCVSPNGSLIAVKLSDDIVLYDCKGNQIDDSCDAYISPRYDMRPHLIKFSPTRYWMTASHGTSLTTYNLEDKDLYTLVSPRISRSELASGKFPTCNALWYSKCGNFLFSLFSNDKLYWWHIEC